MLNLTLCLLGNFSCFFVICWFFSKSTFLKNSFRNTIRVSNSLDPDQARHFVGPDLGPNCLQKLSAEILLKAGDLEMTIFSGEKPFKCSVCGQGLNVKFNMKSHYIMQHAFKGMRLRDLLNVLFRDRDWRWSLTWNLIIWCNMPLKAWDLEMTIFSGEKPFKCFVCGQGLNVKFNMKFNAKSHYMMQHTFKGKRPRDDNKFES